MRLAGYDLETTGFVEPDHRIIEICIASYDFDPTGAVAPVLIEVYNQRINPSRNVPLASSNVHGIYIEDLKTSPAWDIVAPEIFKRLNAADIGIAHNNIGFDAPFLIQEFDRIKHPLPDFEPFDTMLEGRWATPYGKVPSLRELCFACGVDYVTADAHAADYDVRVMMKSFFYGFKHGHFRL